MEQTPIVDDYNFVRLGGRTFTITEINIPTLDRLVEEIKSTNTERVQALTNQLRVDFVRESSNLATQEHQRIIQDLQNASVSVPNNLHCLPVVVIRGTLCPVRNVIFTPSRVYGSVSGWVNRLGSTNRVFNVINTHLGTGRNVLTEAGNRMSEAKIVITGMPHFNHCCSVLFSKHVDKLLMSRQLYHTLNVYDDRNGMPWWSMCIGNSTADQYWAMPIQQFTRQISEINLDSPATTVVTINNMSVDVTSLIENMTNRVVQFIPPTGGW